MRLRPLLRSLFADWTSNYSPAWGSVLNGVSPNVAGVPGYLWLWSSVPLIPRPHDFSAPLGSNDFHTMRALDRVSPSDVRVVVLGQDPFPRWRDATGRAFEQGSLDSWTGDAAASFQRFIQRVAQHRSGDDKYADSNHGWRHVANDATALGLPTVKALYDGWEDQGIIFLNYVLTYTLPRHVFRGHARFWTPVVTTILHHLATRQSKNVVFATFGSKPREFFVDAGVLDAAQAAGTDANCRHLRFYHPNAPRDASGQRLFLKGENQFSAINAALAELGEQQITW